MSLTWSHPEWEYLHKENWNWMHVRAHFCWMLGKFHLLFSISVIIFSSKKTCLFQLEYNLFILCISTTLKKNHPAYGICYFLYFSYQTCPIQTPLTDWRWGLSHVSHPHFPFGLSWPLCNSLNSVSVQYIVTHLLSVSVSGHVVRHYDLVSLLNLPSILWSLKSQPTQKRNYIKFIIRSCNKFRSWAVKSGARAYFN